MSTTSSPEPFLKTWWCPKCGKTETRTFEAHYDSGHKCAGRPVIQWYRLKGDTE